MSTVPGSLVVVFTGVDEEKAREIVEGLGYQLESFNDLLKIGKVICPVGEELEACNRLKRSREVESRDA